MEQRKASHELVNGAYTSQMNSTTGLLQGKRSGDKFYRMTGDVLQADHNAALDVLAILLSRSPAQLSVNRLELAAEAAQPSADKSFRQV